MKIGIFGGTFDPPHYGHINLARQIKNEKKLDKIIFVLSAAPPHKPDFPVTSFEHRLKMLELAITDTSGFELSTLEKERLPLPSYTYDTMISLSEKYKTDQLYIIIGGDSLLQLHSWYKAEQIVRQWDIITYPRPGQAISLLNLQDKWPRQSALKLYNSIISSELYSISSTDIRQKISSNYNLENLLPDTIINYIRKNNLYIYTQGH